MYHRASFLGPNRYAINHTRTLSFVSYLSDSYLGTKVGPSRFTELALSAFRDIQRDHVVTCLHPPPPTIRGMCAIYFVVT